MRGRGTGGRTIGAGTAAECRLLAAAPLVSQIPSDEPEKQHHGDQEKKQTDGKQFDIHDYASWGSLALARLIISRVIALAMLGAPVLTAKLSDSNSIAVGICE